MPRRRNPNIQNKESLQQNAYIAWGSEDKQSNIEIARSIDSIRPIFRSTSAAIPTPTLTARQGLSKFDYELFRPGERTAFHFRGILEACMAAYERIGIVRNIIDLMGDFTSQGIKIVHPNPGIEKFYQNWWNHINGNDISERFANLFYRTANPIVRRNMAKVKSSVLEDLRNGYSAAEEKDRVEAGILAPFDLGPNDYFSQDFFHDYDQVPEKMDKPVKNLIPWEYDFLNPLFITLMGGELALFSGQRNYGLDIPKSLLSTINSPKNQAEIDMVNAIPDYITNAVRNGSQVIPLDPSRISIYHYKKDSWQVWAYPLIYAVMDELIILQKLKMADLSALDGACSRIRVWKLGNLDLKMFPTEVAIEKLSSILQHAGNGQALDIIWGPDISFEETKTDFHQFLGKEKYIPTLESIYASLGIPPSLTGTTGGAGSGSSNSSLSLKILIERLNYGRDALTHFWNREIKIVQRALGFRIPARVEYKNMILSDETAQNQILINLLDRDVISLERVRDHFGFIPEIEDAAIKKDYRDRDSKKIPPKASPYHDANPELSLEKIFAQQGIITPNQVGLELDDKGENEVSSLDIQMKNHKLQQDQFDHQKKINNLQTKQTHQLNMKKQKDDTSIKKLSIKQGITTDEPPGQPGEGRPKNSVDTQPRKPRVTQASIEEGTDFISLQLWARSAQETISDIINPKFLKKCNKKNMRSLTVAEIEEVEHLKWVLLCNISPNSEITNATIATLLAHTFPANTEADAYWRVCVASRVAQTGAAPTIEDIKQIQSYIYALCKGDYGGKSND